MSIQNRPGRRMLLLWTALLLPATAWFAQLTANYMIAAYACTSDRMWILHTISIAALVLTAVGLRSAWRLWRVRRQHDASGQETSWLGATVLLLDVLFLLGVIWNELSNWLLEPCV